MYSWSGIRPTSTANSSTCLTQLSPATVRQQASPNLARPTATATGDGTNYYLVAKRVPYALKAANSDDPILKECQQPSMSVPAILDVPLTTASFITITITRTETRCKPMLMCNVREEKTATGGLVGPSGLRLPAPQARPSPAQNAGAAAPFGTLLPPKYQAQDVDDVSNHANKE